MHRFYSLLALSLLLSACGGEPQQAIEEYKSAVEAFAQKEPDRGFALLLRAADDGSLEAAEELGSLYLRGNGVPKDLTKAFAYFTKAAEGGRKNAQYNLGLMSVRGDGTKKDLRLAAQWFKKAARQGDVGAQYNIGLMYLNGEGVAQNPSTAYAWFAIAASQGYEGAKGMMSVAKRSLTDEQLVGIEAVVEGVRRTVRN